MYRHVVVFVAIVFLLLTGLNMYFDPLFHINTTQSADRGIYVSVPHDGWHRGDMVVVSNEEIYGRLDPDHKFLKFIRGLPGDTYIVRTNELEIHGKTYPIYKHKLLPSLPEGEYVVPEGMYLMLNDVPKSFDSRYFGPVKESNLEQKAVMFFNTEPVYKAALAWLKFDMTVWVRTMLGK